MTYPYADTEDLDFAEGESWAGENWPGENWDNYFEAENWEAARRRRGRPQRPVPTAKGANAFRGRGPSSGPVTQAQLAASLAQVRQEMQANATGIKTLDGRVRAATASQQRFETVTRRQVDKLRSDLKTTQTLSALIPLLTSGTQFEKVAPLIHLVSPDLASGTTATAAGPGSSPGGLLGNTNNLIAIGGLLYATGTFDKSKK
ncbi:hypothetical protein [Paracoccus sp. MC1862]|uniref:hypothetical protein n=1 Tax=Paracoccus sp. MC1862 TaxID=2760307 RepID=UPI001602C8CC|nr:hypothetical protein [Paracoccus sp. MC1862]MBB1499338.1 hypothetical protein [Paracoccus sp. MC1862]QQO45105.1 hypothetical protein JGR78_01490 [Paracoccus sp. MC1862]